MSISCTYECENRYKKDIEQCHITYEVETLAFTENDFLINCIRKAEDKYQNCLK